MQELELLLQTVARVRPRVHVLLVPMHGSGVHKPKRLSRRYGEKSILEQQGTTIRKLDSEVVRALQKKHGSAGPGIRGAGELSEGSTSKAPPFLILDLFHMAREAECWPEQFETGCVESCGGAYESHDGTHLSPTVNVNAALIIFRLISLLGS